MAVTLNANNAAPYYTTAIGLTNDHTGLTIAAGSNIVLIVLVARSGFPHTTTMNWDQAGTPQALTLLGSQDAGAGVLGHCDIWGLVNPTTGNRTLRSATTAGTGGEMWMNAVAFNNVASFGTPIAATGNSNSASRSVTSASGDMTVAIATGPEVFGTITQTPLFEDDTGGAFTSAAATRSTGTVDPTHTFPFNNAVEWVVLAMNLVQVAAGSSSVSPSVSPSSSVSLSPSPSGGGVVIQRTVLDYDE